VTVKKAKTELYEMAKCVRSWTGEDYFTSSTIRKWKNTQSNQIGLVLRQMKGIKIL